MNVPSDSGASKTVFSEFRVIGSDVSPSRESPVKTVWRAFLVPKKFSKTKRCIAEYGSVVIPRDKCRNCGIISLVIDGKTACCEVPPIGSELKPKKMSDHADRYVVRLAKSEKKRILLEQNNRCLYCNREFGSFYTPVGKRSPIKVVLNWDHFVPFAYSRTNNCEYVAACSRCNIKKGALIFDTLEQAILHVSEMNPLSKEERKALAHETTTDDPTPKKSPKVGARLRKWWDMVAQEKDGRW